MPDQRKPCLFRLALALGLALAVPHWSKAQAPGPSRPAGSAGATGSGATQSPAAGAPGSGATQSPAAGATGSGATQSPAAGAPEIIPPDPLAIELPAGATSLGPDDPALRDLIARTQAGGDRLTVDLPRHRIGAGLSPIIFSAWTPDDADHPVARREAWLFVLPHGMTPIGSSGASNAVAGNNTTHIVRDASGSVHMVWFDDWRGGAVPGVRYRRALAGPEGVRLETDVQAGGDPPGNWTALPAIAAVGDTIHIVWQADGVAHYRALRRDGDRYVWGDSVNTKIGSGGRDTGPAIAADGTAIHILTPSSVYGVSNDGGRTWTAEPVRFGGDTEHVKTVSLTLDNQGRPVAAASSIVSGPESLTEDSGHGGYWTIRLMRRVGPGVWERLPGPLDGRAEWAAPARANEDVLADWVRVAADKAGGLHAAWHGTAVSRIYAHDRAYYAWRSPDGQWTAPTSLHEPDPRRGFGWSYAPGLILDGDRALTLSFHEVHAGHQGRGFDAELNQFRDGRLLSPELPVTRFAETSVVTGEPHDALSAWFPGAAPALVRDKDGRVWADILLALSPTDVPAPTLIVWDRLELTDWLTETGQ